MTDSPRKLAREIASLIRRVTALERAPRLRNASLEGTAINVYNSDGSLVQVIGQQSDGTYTTADFNTTPPPTPAAPIVTVRPGALIARWGSDTNTVQQDFANVEVHVSRTSGFTPTASTQVLEISSKRAGQIVDNLRPGTYYVRLVMCNSSGVRSAPSSQVSVNVPPVVTYSNTDIRELLAGTGDRILSTSYRPIAGSERVYWNGRFVPTADWTRDGQTITIPDPSGLLRGGDLLSVVYAYDPTVTLVDFQSAGWSWVQSPPAADLDYSSVSFDDSSWALGTAPFGQTDPPHTLSFDGLSWPDYTTLWEQGTAMWARRTVAAEPGLDVSISVRWNRTVYVHWNGSGSTGTTSPAGERTFTFPGSSVLASNVLAIKTVDEGFTGPGTGCYFDAQVTQ